MISIVNFEEKNFWALALYSMNRKEEQTPFEELIN